MTTRRDFLKFNVGAASLALLFPAHILGSSVALSAEQPLYAFLHDPQISEANALAKRMFAKSRSTFSAGGDLASIWLNELRPQVSKEPTYIAGLTSGFQAFSIQEAARDLGHAIVHSRHYDRSLSEQDGLAVHGDPGSIDRLDVLSLNSPAPVIWLLGPSGIKFHA